MLYKQNKTKNTKCTVNENENIMCYSRVFRTHFTLVKSEMKCAWYWNSVRMTTHTNENRERKYREKKEDEHKCLSKQVHVLTTQKTYRDVFPF